MNRSFVVLGLASVSLAFACGGTGGATTDDGSTGGAGGSDAAGSGGGAGSGVGTGGKGGSGAGGSGTGGLGGSGTGGTGGAAGVGGGTGGGGAGGSGGTTGAAAGVGGSTAGSSGSGGGTAGGGAGGGSSGAGGAIAGNGGASGAAGSSAGSGNAGSSGTGGSAGTGGGASGAGGSGTSGAGGSAPTCDPSTQKMCGSGCVSLGDPATGCNSVTCSPCSLPHAKAMCVGGCTLASCDAGYLVYDVATPGCEAPVASCKDLKVAHPSLASGLYSIDPDGAGPKPQVQVYCDMTTDGGGWTLVGRSAPGGWAPGCAGTDGGATFGWSKTMGAVADDSTAYALDAADSGLVFDTVLFGSYSAGKTWDRAYRQPLPAGTAFVSTYATTEIAAGMATTVAGDCPDPTGMFSYIGLTGDPGLFHWRDVPGGGFGLTASGWATCYEIADPALGCYAGKINGLPGMIMVR